MEALVIMPRLDTKRANNKKRANFFADASARGTDPASNTFQARVRF